MVRDLPVPIITQLVSQRRLLWIPSLKHLSLIMVAACSFFVSCALFFATTVSALPLSEYGGGP